MIHAKERLVAFVKSSADARRMSWSELIQHRELNCSSCTLQRYLHDAGFQRCLAVPEPWLTEKQKQDRLDWAIEHADWGLIEWLRVIWTDESAVCQKVKRKSHQ